MYAAAALNYSVIEKPVVPVPEEIDVDGPWTMRVDDIESIRKKVEACWLARGKTYRPKRYPAMSDHPARMGLVTARPVKAGDMIGEDSVRFAWPRHGISVYDWDIVAGGVFMRDIASDTPIHWQDVSAHSKS
jgi:sialic acid synthase SpsE